MTRPPRHTGEQPNPDRGVTRRGLLRRQAALGAGYLTANVVLDGLLAGQAAASSGLTVHPQLYPLPRFTPEIDLRGKVAVITGASTGIGRAAGEALAAQGVHVIGTSRDAASVIRPPRFPLLNLDVTEAGSIDTFVRLLRRHLTAGGKIDILINNAGRGIVGTPLPPAGGEEKYLEQLQLGIKTDYTGHLTITNRLLPLMPVRGYARVYFTISISAYSVATHILNPLHGYIAAKRALIAFANAWSSTLGQGHPNIGVATINPYTTNTRWGDNLILLQKAPNTSPIGRYVEAVRNSLAHAQPASVVGKAYWQMLSTVHPPLNVAAGSMAKPYGASNQLYALELLAENSQAAFQFGC
jgi:NAD(P)-dependent dehydrogenase (short-subunit alcohol dehydrogenase family)